jgi:raffinose/stachyose/melibiose transport system permease protein
MMWPKMEAKLMKSKGANVIFLIFTIPALVLYTMFFVYPMITGAVYSLTNWKGLTNKFDFIGFKNYIKFFRDSRALSSTWFSLKYTTILAICINVISLFLAVILGGKLFSKRKVNFFRSIYFFPAVLSLIVVGLIWNEIFYRAFPLIGETLGIDFLKTNLLVSKSTAMYGVLLVNLWQGIAIPFVMLTAAIQNIPQDLYECADLEGIKPLKKFTKITFPFLIPTFNVTLVLSIKGGLTAFDYMKVLTNGGPAGSTESIGMFIYEQGISSLKYGYSTAVSLILMIIIGSTSLGLMKLFSKYEVGQL